jgi:hypothetical protein
MGKAGVGLGNGLILISKLQYKYRKTQGKG